MTPSYMLLADARDREVWAWWRGFKTGLVAEAVSIGLVAAVVAIGLGGCSQPGTVSGSVTPRADQETTLIIRVVPAHVLLESGHRTGPGPADTRPYTYRVQIGNKTYCGMVQGDDILAGGPGSLSRLDWEIRNCEGHGGDFP